MSGKTELSVHSLRGFSAASLDIPHSRQTFGHLASTDHDCSFTLPLTRTFGEHPDRLVFAGKEVLKDTSCDS